MAELAPDVAKHQVRADGIGGNGHAFDDGMRIAFHEHAVLAGAWFGLVGVATEIARLGRILGHKTPFYTGRESGPTTSAQAGILNFIDNLPGFPFREHFAPGLISAVLFKFSQLVLMFVFDVSEEMKLVALRHHGGVGYNRRIEAHALDLNSSRMLSTLARVRFS